MKIRQWVRSAFFFAAVVAFVAVAVTARAQTPLLYVDPDTTVQGDGNNFTLDIAVSGDVTGLMGWDITLTFDNSIIQFLGVSEGSLPLSSGPSFFWTEPGLPAGTVHVNGAILGHTVDGPGVLVTLEFKGHAPAGVDETDLVIAASVMRTGVNEDIVHDTADGHVKVQKEIATESVTWGMVKHLYATRR